MTEKLERQMSLLATLLQTDHPLTAADLQERVAGYPEEKTAFRRAFERDKDDLRRLGVPIETARIETVESSIDGYHIQADDYYLHDLGLDPDETVALAMALRLIRLEGGPASDDALWKLGGAAFADEAPAEVAAISMGPAVTTVHEAIAGGCVIEFDYRGQVRTVEPWRLAFRRGHWYVQGHDVDRGASRTFRLDRIDGAIGVRREIAATHPRPAAAAERQPWQFGEDDDVVTARILVDAEQAEWTRRQLGDEAVVAERPDGRIEFEMTVNNVAGFRSFVLGLLDAAEVLSPPELRDDLIVWLEGQLA